MTQSLARPLAAPCARQRDPDFSTLVKFGPSVGFQTALKQRVDRYFERTGLPRRGCPQMYVKTGVMLAWLAASYALLVFAASTWWTALPLAISLGLAVAAVGFNVQHDGGHQAYSDRRWVNRLMALTLDLLGGSSYLWARKHNAIHHSFTNITGADDDINLGPLGRLSPHQKRLWFHRYQHVYLWLLYGFLTVKWHLVDDFRDVITGRIGGHTIARPRGWDLVVFIAGKVVFYSLAMVIPLLLHPWTTVLAFYAATVLVQGVVLSVVFQMAHCVEEAEFPLPSGDPARMENDWAVHQVETTVDFARSNRLLSWYVGGLNFQIEHHLFPQICHVHYPALSRHVERICRDFGLRYRAHDSLVSSIASHYRWLRRMGRPLPALQAA